MRRAVDVGGEIPMAIDFEEGDFILRKTAIIHVRKST